MKIVVAHDGKQHVNRLLIALQERGWLNRFYTGFATNSVPAWLTRVGFWREHLRKRQFAGVPNAAIRSHYVSAWLTRLTRSSYWHVRLAYWLFDGWVARHLRRDAHFDVLIGYENSNLRAFQTARQLGKVTILDLAHVHHAESLAIRQRFTGATPDAPTQYVNARKQRALAVSRYVFTLSGLATDSLTARGFPRERIYELNLGVDSQFFRPEPSPKPRAKRGFTLLFVGTLHTLKGIRSLLAACGQLNRPGAELILVGPMGDAGPVLAGYAGTFRHVPFLPHDELRTYYQRADLFVFPSYLDSWGQVVLEAMACGTPVVVTENAGAKDAVRRGGGLVVPAGDADALARAIRYVYDYPAERERLGRDARRVAEQYTWENYYKQVTAALTDIAHREGITP